MLLDVMKWQALAAVFSSRVPCQALSQGIMDGTVAGTSAA